MGAFFTISSIGYILILIVHFFSRKGLQNIETRIFGQMLIVTLIGLLLDAIGYVLFANGFNVNSLLYVSISKGALIYFATWEILFTYYIYVISSKKKLTNHFYNVNRIILLILIIIVSIIMISPKLTFDVQNGVIFPQGNGVMFSYFIVGACYVLCIYFALKNIKHITIKRYMPLFAMLIFTAFIPIIQSINPSLYLLNYFISIIIMILYFTIENPDFKMLDEFRKNKEYAEATNHEKEMFLYNITQDMREPLNDIGAACEQLSSMTDDRELSKGITYIDAKSRNLLGIINDVLDITDVETCNIKVYDTKYNPRLLLNELVKMSKEKVREDVAFRINIDKGLPEQLYGDQIRIKQVLKTLLDNSCKFTKKGYIEFSAHEIIKNDLCRLIITVEDSGSGIEADSINEIFDKNKEKIANTNQIDDTKNDLVTARSISGLIGGLLTFNSEIGHGSKFTFILDQRIVKDKSKEVEKIEQYTEKLEKARVLVVSEDDGFLKSTIRKLKKFDLEVEDADLGAKCIEKVRHNPTKYDYILLDANLVILDVFEVNQKIHEIKEFKSQVYVLDDDINNPRYGKNGIKNVISKKLKTEDLEAFER